ncbi:hypothetical protein J6590_002949 [Homalodisca vitripennis]|nr:hypothetical protein J6590_002949 [Homalodisca vitripennis]
MYTLASAIYDCKTKASAILNLDAIEKQLILGNIQTQVTPFQPYVVCTLLAIYLFHLGADILFAHMVDENKLLRILLFDIYFNTVKCSIFSGYVIFTLRCTNLQCTLNEELSSLSSALIQQSDSLYGNILCSRVKYAWSEESRTVWMEKLKLFKKIQGIMYFSELQIGDKYWMYVSWFAIVAAVWSPIIVLLTLEDDNTFSLSKITIATYPVITVVIVSVYFMLRVEKSESLRLLSSVMILSNLEIHHKNAKLQLLAWHHRSSLVSNYLFDVDFSLLANILDTSLLVICTMLTT